MQTMIERVWMRPHKKTRAQAPGTLSAAAFQKWIGEWRALTQTGWNASVVVSADGSHAVGMAWRP